MTRLIAALKLLLNVQIIKSFFVTKSKSLECYLFPWPCITTCFLCPDKSFSNKVTFYSRFEFLTPSRGYRGPKNCFVVRGEEKKKHFVKVLPISPCFEIKSSLNMSKRILGKFKHVQVSSGKFNQVQTNRTKLN